MLYRLEKNEDKWDVVAINEGLINLYREVGRKTFNTKKEAKEFLGKQKDES